MPDSSFQNARNPAEAVALLVGQVYDAASTWDRGQIIVQLLAPLGMLSLMAVANGSFARMGFRIGSQPANIRESDVAGVRVQDVVDLVMHVQQVSIEAVEGLAQVLAASPQFPGSALMALLVAVLLRHGSLRRARAGVAGFTTRHSCKESAE